MSPHTLPQRCHWYAYAIGAVPDHEPGDAVRVCPCCAVPEIVGGEVFAGGADVVAPPFACNASRYVEPQSVDDSTAVPSPHSLNVVTSCHGAFDATMSRTFCAHRVASRASSGVD